MEELIITDLTTDEVIYIPVLPQEFHVDYANNFISYNILSTGEVKVPEGVALSSISWDSFFELEKYKDYPYVNSEHYETPENLHNKLERIKIDGRPCRIMLTGTPINFDCYLESFSPVWKEENRLYYSIKWVQDKPIDVEVVGLDQELDDYLVYRVHVRDQGWTDLVKNGEVCGTTGQCLRMEAIEITSKINGLGVQYQTHLKDLNWQDWKAQGETSGTVGESRRIEAIRIRLYGENEGNYDIFYRLHIRDSGWLEWSQNGESNGTEGMEIRAEAIQIILCKKGEFFKSDVDFTYKWEDIDKRRAAKERGDYSTTNEKFNTYTVKEGDTLWSIALGKYFDSEKWEVIYNANKDTIGSDPKQIQVGMSLIIPEV